MPDEVEQRLREIQERESVASPGPWVWRGNSDTLHTLHDKGEYQYGKTVLAPTYDYDSGTGIQAAEADEDFIANAREDIPWLIALLHEREDEMAKLATLRDAVVSLLRTRAVANDESDEWSEFYDAIGDLGYDWQGRLIATKLGGDGQ